MKNKFNLISLDSLNLRGKVRSFFFIAIVSLFLVNIESLRGQATSRPHKFQIDNFIVILESVPARSPFNQDPTTIDPNGSVQGNGFIAIRNNRLNVRFNVKLRWDSVKRILVATSGHVTGSEVKQVIYDVGKIHVSITGQSVVILPDSAYAPIEINMSTNSFSDSQGILKLKSQQCRFEADGSLMGKNFSGGTSHNLKSSQFKINVNPNPINSVALGPYIGNLGVLLPIRGDFILNENNGQLRVSVSTSLNRLATNNVLKRFQGILINGTASIGNINSFNFNASISSSGQSGFWIYLIMPTTQLIDRNYSGDDGYNLTLKSGKVNLKYRADTLNDLNGSFQCDLLLPKRIKVYEHPSEQVDLLDIKLSIDRNGDLSNYVGLANTSGIPYELAMGTNAMYMTALDTNAYVYFHNWATYGTGVYQKIFNCPNLNMVLDFPSGNIHDPLNIFKRPGITVHKGIIKLFSKQIKTINNRIGVRNDTIQTIFWGPLTLTPYGIVGSITSGGSSFIPAYEPVTNCYVHINNSNPQWSEIIAAGATHPVEPIERFVLQDLKVLEMKIQNMKLCKDSILSSQFTYLIHFPFPSYLNIDFRDTTFNGQMFNSASGPIGSYSYYPNNAFTPRSNLVVVKPMEFAKPNPQAYILWAWRIPLTLVQDGVLINYNKLSQNREDGISIRINKELKNNEGKIFNSEIWIPSLFSDSSAVNCGVRFDCDFTKDGLFKLLNWDHSPYFGSSHTKSFDIYLESVKISDYNSDPTVRLLDYLWQGRIRFPFFCKDDNSTWIPLQFNEKDYVPTLNHSLSIPQTSFIPSVYCCPSDNIEYVCTYNQNPPSSLSIRVDSLFFMYPINKFYTSYLFAQENRQGIVKTLSPGWLNIQSFTDAMFYPSNAPRYEEFIISSGSNECGAPVKESLKNYYSSKSIKDLSCYDAKSLEDKRSQGLVGFCCSEYYIGDYVITSNNREVLYVENTKYYFNGTKKLVLDGSQVHITSEESSEDLSINVPGAQLSYSPDGNIYGAFGATLASVASSLPYEGEFKFCLNPRCGYYYFLGAGSFTYYLRFSGLLFLVHAPYNYLTLSPFDNSTDVIGDMTIRTLSNNIGRFKQLMQFDDPSITQSTIITGFFSAGSASLGIDLGVFDLSLKAGTGNYFFQFKDNNNNNPTFRCGIFTNAVADADFYVLTAQAYMSLLWDGNIPVNNNGYTDLLNNSDVSLSGSLGIEACVSALLAHCSAYAQCSVNFSSRNGLDFEGTDAGAGCGAGGCP